MKKSIILILFIALTSSLMAQKETNLGIQVGAGFGDFRGNSSVESLQSEITLYFGAILEKELGTNTFIRTGLKYGKKQMDGSSISFGLELQDPGDPFINQLSELKTNIEALTIPISYGFKTNGKIKFIATGGGFGSIILSSDGVFSKNFDFGIVASIGIEYSLSDNGSLRLEISDEFGLSNINDTSIFSYGEIRSNRIGAQLTYLFAL